LVLTDQSSTRVGEPKQTDRPCSSGGAGRFVRRSLYLTVPYKWRDQLLTDGAKLFERGGVDHARERLERENRKLTVAKSPISVNWQKL